MTPRTDPPQPLNLDAQDARPISRGANLSRCGRYRYTLIRRWGAGEPLVFCMLNPSTADAEQDDPTIRRCVAFARANGAQALLVVNLLAYRATDPVKLLAAPDPVGPRGHQTLHDVCSNASRVVAAWGAHRATKLPAAVESVRIVREAAAGRLYCLRRTKSGAPSHPLYLPGASPLSPWGPQCGAEAAGPGPCRDCVNDAGDEW